MPSIRVSLPAATYSIHIATPLISRLAALLAPFRGASGGCLVSDATVFSLYGEVVTRALADAGFPLVEPFIIPPGEASKSAKYLEMCWEHYARQGLDRHAIIWVLGGGVPGDLGGFSAATYMRGIGYVQMPTTLLAQVDASIGGKTAINLSSGKNLAGAFHQPLAVLTDPGFLRTLPREHLRNGMAEVVKTAVLGDAGLFRDLEALADSIYEAPGERLLSVIRSCCEIKARIVMQDEKDHGARRVLNLGHTIGHALEAAAGYRALLHGEAVALGLAAAAHIAAAMGRLDAAERDRIIRLLQRLELPVSTTCVSEGAVLEFLHRDKKRTADHLVFILPLRIGQVEIVQRVPGEVIREGIGYIIRTSGK